jgi:ssDNA-binding Zn-finger/Zn-ribbon topoisomerase 1
VRIRRADTSPGPCPLCGSALVARRRKFDGHQFLGCIRFPACRGTIDPSEPTQPRPAGRLRRAAVRATARVAVATLGSIVVYLIAMNAGHVLAEALTR